MSTEYDFDGTSGSFRVTNPSKRLADLLRVEQAKLNRLVISGASDAEIDELKKQMVILTQSHEKAITEAQNNYKRDLQRKQKIIDLEHAKNEKIAKMHEAVEKRCIQDVIETIKREEVSCQKQHNKLRDQKKKEFVRFAREMTEKEQTNQKTILELREEIANIEEKTWKQEQAKNNEIVQMKAQKDKLQTKLTEIQDAPKGENNRRQKDHNLTLLSNETLRTSNKSLRSRIKSLDQNNKDLQERINRLQESNETSNEIIKSLESQLKLLESKLGLGVDWLKNFGL